MLKRKIETFHPSAKRQRPCSETAALADACKGNCSRRTSNVVTAPNSTLQQPVLRNLHNGFNSIDACAAVKHTRSSNTAYAAVGTAGSKKAGDYYQLATGNAVGMNGAYLTNITWDADKWFSAACAAACQSTQESQSTFSSGLAAQQQSAAASTSLGLKRPSCQIPHITSLNGRQASLGSCLLQPPLTSKTCSGQPVSIGQVKTSSDGSCVQARGLYEPSVPKTRDLKEPAVPVSKSAGGLATAALIAGVCNAAPAAAVAPELHASQLYHSTCFWQAAAAAAAATVRQPTSGVAAQTYPAAVEINTVDKYSNHLVNAAPGAAAPVKLKPSDSTTAAAAVWGDSVLGGAPVLRPVITTGMVSAGTSVLPPVPLWSHPAQQTALPNITTYDYKQQQQYGPFTDYQYGPFTDYQQQQQQQYGLTAGVWSSSAARDSGRSNMQRPKQGTRTTSRRKPSSSSSSAAAAPASAASMIKSGVKKSSNGKKRSAASSISKQRSPGLQQAKTDAAADLLASGAAAAAVCINAAATAAAAGMDYAVPTAAAAAAAAAASQPPVTQPPVINQSICFSVPIPTSSAEATLYEALHADYDGVMYGLEETVAAVADQLPCFKQLENAHVAEAAAVAEAEATDEDQIDAMFVAPTVAAADHLTWEAFCCFHNLVEGQPSMLADLDQDGGNSIYDGLGDVGTAAYAAAASAAFKASLEESFDPAPYM